MLAGDKSPLSWAQGCQEHGDWALLPSAMALSSPPLGLRVDPGCNSFDPRTAALALKWQSLTVSSTGMGNPSVPMTFGLRVCQCLPCCPHRQDTSQGAETLPVREGEMEG
jgi:hypothetical protein